jgi:hypothetical protein
MTSINESQRAGRTTRTLACSNELIEAKMPSVIGRIAQTWKSGSGCILNGLSCSLLTCLASVTVNIVIDSGGHGVPASHYLRKLAAGYAAAASVVIVIFPLLPILVRRLRSAALAEPPV